MLQIEYLVIFNVYIYLLVFTTHYYQSVLLTRRDRRRSSRERAAQSLYGMGLSRKGVAPVTCLNFLFDLLAPGWWPLLWEFILSSATVGTLSSTSQLALRCLPTTQSAVLAYLPAYSQQGRASCRKLWMRSQFLDVAPIISWIVFLNSSQGDTHDRSWDGSVGIRAGHKSVVCFVNRVFGSIRLCKKKAEYSAFFEAHFRLYHFRCLQLNIL